MNKYYLLVIKRRYNALSFMFQQAWSFWVPFWVLFKPVCQQNWLEGRNLSFWELFLCCKFVGIHRLCMGGRRPQWRSLEIVDFWHQRTIFISTRHNPRICPGLVAVETRIPLILCCFQSSRQGLIVSISYCCFCGLIGQFLQGFCPGLAIFAWSSKKWAN